MTRHEFGKAVLRAALSRAEGRCEGQLSDDSRCPCALQVGRYHFDHIVPTALTDDTSLGNCQVLCRACHAAKTAVDISMIARVQRVRDRHAGIKDPHRRPLPGGRASPYKRLIGGRVVRRHLGEQQD